MKNEMYFARKTRKLEKEYVKIDNEYLAFVADKLRLNKDLSTAEKYTLLTAFVEEITTGGSIVYHGIFDAPSTDKTASKLIDIMRQYDSEFELTEKRESIKMREIALNKEREEWNIANSPKSSLLPN